MDACMNEESFLDRNGIEILIGDKIIIPHHLVLGFVIDFDRFYIIDSYYDCAVYNPFDEDGTILYENNSMVCRCIDCEVVDIEDARRLLKRLPI